MFFFFFTGIHIFYWWSDSDSKGCFSPALCWLALEALGGGPGDDTVHKRADLICLSVCEWPAAHTVSECDRAAHPTCCANHNLPPTVCFSREGRRKGICKAKSNFLDMSSGVEGEIRSKLSGHRGSNSSNMRGCRKSRFTTLTNKNAILQCFSLSFVFLEKRIKDFAAFYFAKHQAFGEIHTDLQWIRIGATESENLVDKPFRQDLDSMPISLWKTETKLKWHE